MIKRFAVILLAAFVLSALWSSCGPAGPEPGSAAPTGGESLTEPPTLPPGGVIPELTVSLLMRNAGYWNIYDVRANDGSLGYLEVGVNFTREAARAGVSAQIEQIRRIVGANRDVNVFVFTCGALHDTLYFNDVIPESLNVGMGDLYDEFNAAAAEIAAGVAWLDIDTFEKRLEYMYHTDHHWTAAGAYKGYTQVIEMMAKVIPDIGDPLPLKGITVFPNVQYRGSRADRAKFSEYYDVFSVMDIDLPPHTPQVTSQLRRYLNGEFDAGRLGNIYAGMYDGFYGVPNMITYTDNNTGRNLLLIGDSFASWVSFLIGSHFDTVHIYMSHAGKTLDYNKFIRENGITDVLFLQSSQRQAYGISTAPMHFEQIITR